MVDIAEIGFKADSSELVKARENLQALSPVADKATSASAKFNGMLDAVSKASLGLTSAAARLEGASDRLAASMNKSATATTVNKSATDQLNASATRVTATYTQTATAATGASKATDNLTQSSREATAATTAQARAQEELSSAIARTPTRISAPGGVTPAVNSTLGGRAGSRSEAAAQTALMASTRVTARATDELSDAQDKAAKSSSGVAAAGIAAAGALANTGKNLKLRTDEMLNLTRQASDVGVTLAMGMSPLMVAIQQGPQIADVFQTASQRGIGFKAVLGQIGAAATAALAPIAPLLLGVSLAALAIGGGFALGARDINQSAGSIVASMNLTKEELEKLKKAGVDTTVTIGDTFNAFFEVLGERFTKAFAGPINATQKLFTQALNQMATDLANIVRGIAGTFTAAYYGIVATWKNLPGSFAGIGALAGNAFINALEVLLNRAVSQINGINSKINSVLKSAGVDFQFATLQAVKIDRIANPEAKRAGEAIGKATAEGYKVGVNAIDGIFRDTAARARRNRTKLIDDALGDRNKATGRTRATGGNKDDSDNPLADVARERTGIEAPELKTPKIDVDINNRAMEALRLAIDRVKNAMEYARDSVKGFVSDLRTGLAQGQSLFNAFGSAVLNVLNKLLDKLLDVAINAAMGGDNNQGGIGGFLGSLGSALGIGGGGNNASASIFAKSQSGIAGSTPPIAGFAKGGVFTNQVIESRTPFRFARGAAFGEMGEAGPEAVMPLTRGADGSLGVAAHGRGGKGSGDISLKMGDNYFTIAGVVDIGTVRNEIEQSASRTLQDSKKSVAGWINEFQQNGAIAS